LSLSNDIKRSTKSKALFRGLIVRAIEDGIVFFLGWAAIWSLCHVVSWVFQGLGVA
jgi:hypothetical protein